jgi:hypothetical protein
MVFQSAMGNFLSKWIHYKWYFCQSNTKWGSVVAESVWIPCVGGYKSYALIDVALVTVENDIDAGLTIGLMGDLRE